MQVLKKRLEESYDTLQELEEMINCFSNADRLRSFLLGEESFNFGVTVRTITDIFMNCLTCS